MSRPTFFCGWHWCAALALCVIAGGCRTDASLHVWRPAQLRSAVGQQVLVAPLAGPSEPARDVLAAMQAATPRDGGRQVTLRTAEQLRASAHGTVRLASASETVESEQLSDLTLLSLARQAGVDWLLMGEVLSRRQESRSQQIPTWLIPDHTEASGSEAAGDENTSSGAPRLAVVWRLYDVAVAKPVADQSVVVDAASLAESNAGFTLAQAAGREAWRLLTPSVARETVSLAQPWGRWGSKTVRRGNEHAEAGAWPEAERLWQQAYRQHPSQHAAVHNLAIAAVAAQDFSRARQFIRRALELRDCQLYRQSAVWIELQQRRYHRAFALPDPPEGWTLTRDGR